MGRHRNSPHLSFWLPQHSAVKSQGMTLATEWKFCSICFLSFIFRTHTKFGIKIFEIDMLMIFDLLTSPKGHQFDPRMKMLLAFCSACHPRRFDMLHDHVWRKIIVWPPWYPSAQKSHPWGMTQGTEWKSRLICLVSFICENTHKVWYKKNLKLTL